MKFADYRFQKVLQLIVRMLAPINIVVDLLHGQTDGFLDCCQTQFVCAIRKLLQLIFVVFLIHVGGYGFDHFGECREAVAEARII